MNLYLLMSIINRIENGDPFFRMFLESTVIWYYIYLYFFFLIKGLFHSLTLMVIF